MKNILKKCTGKYLSENISEFPFADETFFGEKSILFINKGITGCGGTTMVAESAMRLRYNVVCLMPTVSSVQSKEQQFLTYD